MPTYRVTKKSFLQITPDSAPRLYKPGDIVEYDGPPGTNLEQLSPEEMKRLERQRAQRPPRSPAELNQRVERLEDAVGEDALKAADKKKLDEQAAEAKRVEDERKKAEEAAAKKRADDRKAKDDAAKKAEKDAAAKPASDPNIIQPAAPAQPAEPLANKPVAEETRTR